MAEKKGKPDLVVPPPPAKASLQVLVLDTVGNNVTAIVKIVIKATGDSFDKLTQKDGLAIFENLSPGDVTVTADAGGKFGPIPDNPKNFKPGVQTGTVTIKPGPDPTELRIVFAQGNAHLKVLVRKGDHKSPLPKVPVTVTGLPPKTTDSFGIADYGEIIPGTLLTITAGTADVTKKPLFGPITAPPNPATIGVATVQRLPSTGEDVQAILELEEKKLEIVKIDDHFAPVKEKLEIRFSIRGLSGRVVKLTIEGDNFAGKKLVERNLGAAETADGDSNLIAWDGKIEIAGASNGKAINPLMGPFRVRLFHDDANHTGALKSEKPFKVLYHSIELKQGVFTPDEKEPPTTSQKDWVQFKLNQLGFYGGPVGNDTEDYLKKAIIRYKANHKKMYQFLAGGYTDAIDATLISALTANENSRPFLVGDPFASATSVAKVMVEELYYMRTGTGPTATEFMAGGKRITFEAQRLNRPLIPIEAVINLKGKSNNKVLVPEAVGPLRINFRFTDSNEDLSPMFGAPTRAKQYVEAALKLVSGRTGTNGDNCPDTLKGARKGAAAVNYDQPFLLGNFLKPYTTAADAAQAVVFSTASVDAALPLRLGKAGIFFRPSFIAGDDYQLKAEIDFTGLPNKATLEADHHAATVDKRIQTKTGIFKVTRQCKVAMVVNWPARSNAAQFDQIALEYAKAHIEMDVGSIVTRDITAVLTNAEYLAVVNGSGATVPAGAALRASSFYGTAPPAQGNLNAAAYKNALRVATYTNYNDKCVSQMGNQICQKLRNEFPIGHIVINFFEHDPVDVKTNPAGGDNTVAPKNAQFAAWGASVGLADGMVFVDMKDPDKVYYVVAHEFGHHYYLSHWENAGGSPLDHDTADHNCIMSYSNDSVTTPVDQRLGIYTPHFCGKCIMNLRGWDYRNALMPAHS